MLLRPLASGVEVFTPAKLNLFLEILGKRPDGYHEIETLMVAIDLHDRLTITPDETGRITLRCDDPTLPSGPENLVVKAAEKLRAEAGPERSGSLGAEIVLEKAIPAQAGLGGGSSDAAATLAALDRLWGLATPAERLAELAGEIGSDVPFFLSNSAAVCRGRGERCEGLGEPPAYWFVLVNPPTGVRTADVYGGLVPPERPEPIGPVLEAFASGDPARMGRCLHNRLQPVAERINPVLGEVRRALEDMGSSLDGTLMSGSGSAYFGLARDRNAATHAARRLNDLGLGRARVVGCEP
jgi:4-diphosphocytidyl-2-C-methyl-D-erythritol kinase